MAPKAKQKIPEFASVQEEAAFWDSHDTADYEGEFKPVKVRFTRSLSRVLSVRLDAETLEAMRAIAHERGIGPATLARMWILERLRAEKSGA